MARFLRDGRPEADIKPYASTQTGNFDLYLPFIEKGLSLLNEKERLGFIAPSLWTTNEYGAGLRNLVSKAAIWIAGSTLKHIKFLTNQRRTRRFNFSQASQAKEFTLPKLRPAKFPSTLGATNEIS